MTVVYDQAFFDLIRPGVQRSAAAMVPYLLAGLEAVGCLPGSVVDVGCGEGWWLAEFAGYGLEVTGIDGDEGGGAIPSAGLYRIADLAEPLNANVTSRRYDLALSLEVAEHLPPGRADAFVRDLCALAPVVIFSAAIPGQGGHGHLNEQWPGYWADLFNAAGYSVTGEWRYGIWEDDRIENWYRQNLLVAWDPEAVSLTPIRPLPLVHPKLWEHYRQ